MFYTFWSEKLSEQSITVCTRSSRAFYNTISSFFPLSSMPFSVVYFHLTSMCCQFIIVVKSEWFTHGPLTRGILLDRHVIINNPRLASHYIRRVIYRDCSARKSHSNFEYWPKSAFDLPGVIWVDCSFSILITCYTFKWAASDLFGFRMGGFFDCFFAAYQSFQNHKFGANQIWDGPLLVARFFVAIW